MCGYTVINIEQQQILHLRPLYYYWHTERDVY